MKRDISACEALIKKQQENEEHLKTIIENQKNTMADLKRKLESGPAFHTLEYLEDSFSKKISCLKDSIKETITSEYQKIIKCNTDQNSMSYADATKSKTNEDLICNSVKLAVKKANKEEKSRKLTKREEYEILLSTEFKRRLRIKKSTQRLGRINLLLLFIPVSRLKRFHESALQKEGSDQY